jgi:Tol biopolymer transport system component
MSLAAGSKLGPYEILVPIGAGGMGEVYRARDPRLNRDVAIKVSAARFSERFEREAKAIAALNHPNICQIYDVGPNYLVMELIEGENLKGPVPLETAIKYAGQIADALEAAHEKSIVHRDLKPANIKITPAGVVKILDFGLAKHDPAPSGPIAENSPTLSMGMTQAGVILGTAAYMSPEQARGEPVDKRADIWAFGVVFYEMLAGQRMYQGKTVSDILAAVLIKEPDLSKVPPQVRKLLRRCLEKDPKKRLRDIADAMPMLEEEPPATLVAAKQGTRGRAAWSIVASVLLLIAAAAGFSWWRATQPVEQPLVRLDVDLGADVSLATPNGSSNVIISPDGTRLVYVVSVAGGAPKLFIRRLDQPKGVELPGTQGAYSPFFSPDGQWVGFTVIGKMSKISVEGGAAVPIGDGGTSPGASWGEDGNVIYSVLNRGLFRISSGGGPSTSLAELTGNERAFIAPQILLGGKAVLSAVNHTALDSDKASIEILTLADHRRKIVGQGGTSARYLATSNNSGYLVYANKSTLFAVPFDLDHLEKRGTPVPVLDDVGFNPQTYESQFDVSRTGTMVYRKATAGAANGMRTIQWVDAAGKRTPLADKPGNYSEARLSPDGKRLAANVLVGGNESIQVYDLQRETWTRLTFDAGEYRDPIWSPDGQTVAFATAVGMFWARADGASQPQRLTQKRTIQAPSSIAPDGKRLAFFEIGAGNMGQLWTVPLENTGGQLKAGTPEPFLKSAFSEVWPAFSPDGKWLAYGSNSSGTNEVYVRAFPDNGSQWKISNNGGNGPIWSGTGHDLLYQSRDQEMAVSYSANGSTFVAEKPRVWLAKVGGSAVDISPDGKRLVVLAPVESPDAPKAEHEVVLLQNFFDELRRKVPAGK